MICGNCKFAPADKRNSLHKQCAGRTEKTHCDCQHLSNSVNWTQIERDRANAKAASERPAEDSKQNQVSTIPG